MRKFVFLGVFVGLLTMRIFWSSWLFNDDFYNYLTWIESLFRLGPFGFYSRDFSPWAQANYPPLTTGLFATFHLLARWLFPHEQSCALLATFYKLPRIFLETMLAVYMLWRKKYLLSTLLLFNPAIWYNILWWGQTEGLMTIFVMLGLISILYRKLFISVVFF